MSSVLRFKMSGRTFAYDGARDLSALEVTELRNVGVTVEELVALLGALGEGELMLSVDAKLRAMCALAYLAALREDPATEWRPFAASIYPSTFEVLPDPMPVAPAVAEQAQQAAAAPSPNPLFDALQGRQASPPAP